MKLISTLFIAAAIAFSASAKEKLNVLYVGGSSNVEIIGAKPDPVAVEKGKKERMANFSKFLKDRFSKVTVIDASEYNHNMSDNFDITIFDGTPTPIRPQIREVDANGRTIRYERAAMLPYDFNRAVLCIASASDMIGRSIGTKNDWYCLCLDNYSFNWNKNHEIFKGPFKVEPPIEMRDVPEPAREVAKMKGKKLPEQIEMWKVAELSYQDPANSGIRIGMVSRPGGYLDSPEAEVISGGTSAKSFDAISIGRHGNFFHWGYAADPKGLTEAGRNLLANAIVYASKFNGKNIIARKKNDGITTRDHLDMIKWGDTRDAWRLNEDSNMQFYLQMDSIIKDAKKAQTEGKELTAKQQMYLQFPAPQKPTPVSYSDYVKNREPKLYHVFGDDEAEYARYYDRNLGYFYPDASGYHLDIDEQVRSIGFANNDVRMLDKAISLLEANGLEAADARQVLERYTLCRFETPAEWRAWFNANRNRLFFTESGGWLWLVNTDDPNVVGNDYSVLEKKNEKVSEAASKEPAGVTDEKNPVALKASVENAKDGSKLLVLTMTVHPGYHAYASVDPEDPFMVVEVGTQLPEGVKALGNINKPTPKATNNKTTHYVDTVRFTQKLPANAKGKASWNIKYQVCDNTVCLRPEDKTVSVEI